MWIYSQSMLLRQHKQVEHTRCAARCDHIWGCFLLSVYSCSTWSRLQDGPQCRGSPFGGTWSCCASHGPLKGSGRAGKALRQEITWVWRWPAEISWRSLSTAAGRHFSSFSACLQYLSRISLSSLRCSRELYTHDQIIWALLEEKIGLAAKQARSGYTFIYSFIFFPTTTDVYKGTHI